MADSTPTFTNMPKTQFTNPFAEEVWESTYKYHTDNDINDTFHRVAGAIASVEDESVKDLWHDRFYNMLTNFTATTGGRIYTNAGTEFEGTTLINCFPAGNLVTTNKGLVPIEDIRVGDLVLTHTGSYKSVVNTMQRDVSCDIDRYSSPHLPVDITVTQEHPFYQPDGSWVNSEDNTKLVFGHNTIGDDVDGIHHDNGVMYLDVKKCMYDGDITKSVEFFNGIVYNISVDEDESYVINNIVVHNCFVSPHIENSPDSIAGIYETLTDQAQTLKSEGGWGHNFSALRPRGTFIEGVGVDSPGSIAFMELFDVSSKIVTSGSGVKASTTRAKKKIRKGAMMSILDVHHPDIIEFIQAKQTPGRLTKFNMSVNATDEFMELVIKAKATGEDLKWDLVFPDTTHPEYDTTWKGDLKEWKSLGYPVVVHNTVSVLWLWDLMMKSTYNRAEPGIMFLDRANEYYSYNYGNTLTASNPCVPDYSCIQTINGPKLVAELIGKPTTLLVDGTPYDTTDAGFFKTGTKDVYRMITKEGFSVDATADHLIATMPIGKKSIEWVPMKDMQKNDRVVIHDHSDAKWDGIGSKDEGYILGLLFGDGYISAGKGHICVWHGDDQTNFSNDGADAIMEKVSKIVGGEWIHIKGRGEYRMTNKMVQELLHKFGIVTKEITPTIVQTSSEFHKGFISGLFDADGSVQGNADKGFSIRLSQSDKPMLEEVQRMMIRVGVFSKLYLRRDAADKLLPDGKGGQKHYPCKAQYELIVSADNIPTFVNTIGFEDYEKQNKAVAILEQYTRGPYSKQKIATFEGMEHLGVMDVYDCQVPGINAFDSNGVMIHNCGEQLLPPGGSCDLGSINLTQFVNEDRTFNYDKFTTMVRTLVRFLDNVNSYTRLPLPEYEQYVREKRRIGCGIMGWASMLYMMKIKFASDEAAELRELIMKTYAHTCHEASIDLAEEKGMFIGCDPEKHANTQYIKMIGLSDEYMDKLRRVGIRNSALMSCQPTGNTSIFSNVVSGGIEPIFAQSYIRTVIVNETPDSIMSRTPKFWQGEMHETELFKWAKEGDEDILRGEHEGVVYKIDGNRGLTKEVPCIDYGVKWLMDRGEWDADATWAVTAMSLTPDDHVSDLKGFAKWIDSSLSKCVVAGTMINTNHGAIPIEDFSDGFEAPDTFIDPNREYYVCDENGDHQKVTSHYYGGVAECYEITMSNGQTIKCSENHKLKTDHGFMKPTELAVGSYVLFKAAAISVDEATMISMPSLDFSAYHTYNKVTVPTVMTESYATFLGMFAADGFTNVNSFGIVEKDESVGIIADSLMESLFGVKPAHSVDERTGVITHVIHSRPLVKYLNENFGKGCVGKIIPPQILASPHHIQRAYINGITLDGYLNPPTKLVLYEGYSQNIADGLATMVAGMGLPYYKGQKHVATGVLSDTAYSCAVYGNHPFVPLEAHKRVVCKDGVWPRYIDQSRVDEILANFGHGIQEITDRRSMRNSMKRDNFVRSNFLDKHDIPYDDTLYGVKVVSVSAIGPHEVYDIEVENTHTYLIDGLVSHNTVNLPHDFPFDQFEDVYLDAYKEKYIKGITTYRSGTMTSVLSEAPSEAGSDEEIIMDDVKLPDSSPATMKVLRAEGRKWYLTVLHNHDQTEPLALFVHTNAVEKTVQTSSAIDALLELARDKGIPDTHINNTVSKIASDSNSSKIARVVSLNLRHGVLIKNIVFELDKLDDIIVGSFLFQVKKFLSSYVKDGEVIDGAVCEICESTEIVFSEGCSKCTQCGSSKCS